MKNLKRNLIILFLLLAAATSWLVWRNHSTQDNSKYHTEKLQIGNITQTVAANGTLNPVILVNVGTQVSGTVQKIYADFNDHVTANQTLLQLDPKLLQSAVNQSLALCAKAEAALELAKLNEKRGVILLKGKFISQQDFDQLVETRKVTAADLKAAEAQHAKDRINLGYATIISPVSGVVVDREIDVGQTVAASFQTPTLYKIAQDLSKMQIDSSFAEADIGNIRPQQAVNFTVDAFPTREFHGIVKQIRLNPTTQQNVVTYDVVVTVDNPDGVLLPGMTAYVNIKTAEHKNVLLVPNAALRFQPKNKKTANGHQPDKSGEKVLYKLIAAKPTPIPCSVGITDNHFSEVTSKQLKAGDEVIINEGEDTENQAAATNSFRFRVI